MTYRDLLQETIREIWVAYEKIGAIRDTATNQEKAMANKARGAAYDAAIALSSIDNALTPNRAKMEL